MKKSTKIIIRIVAAVIMLVIAVIAIIIASARGKSNDYNKHMELAHHFLDELKYEQAIVEYEAAIAIDPKNTEAYISLAKVYIELEDYEAAVEILEQGVINTESEELTVYLEKVQEEYHVVQEGKESKTEIENSDNQSEQNGNIPGESEEDTERDNSGNQIEEENAGAREEVVYDKGGYYICEYDANGNMVKSTFYYSDSSMDFYNIYEYDANGNIIKTIFYNADGTIDWIYEYDANGNMVKKSIYNADGTIYRYWIYEYDANGNMIKSTTYNADGSLDSETVY